MRLHLKDREYGGIAVGTVLVVLFSLLVDTVVESPRVVENYTRFVMER